MKSKTNCHFCWPAALMRCCEQTQVPLVLLGICDRRIVASFPAISVYHRLKKGAPTNPQTLGEHLRLARIDRRMTNVQVAHVLGVAYQTIEGWEHNRHPITPRNRAKIVAFIGYDPNPKGKSPAGDF